MFAKRALSLQRGPARAGAGSSPLHAFCEVREMVGTRSASTCSTAPPLALHLLLQLVEEAPVGALGDDLLRGTLDQANLVQAQGIKAHRVFWVIFPPAIIGNLLQRLPGVSGDLKLHQYRRFEN